MGKRKNSSVVEQMYATNAADLVADLESAPVVAVKKVTRKRKPKAVIAPVVTVEETLPSARSEYWDQVIAELEYIDLSREKRQQPRILVGKRNTVRPLDAIAIAILFIMMVIGASSLAPMIAAATIVIVSAVKVVAIGSVVVAATAMIVKSLV